MYRSLTRTALGIMTALFAALVPLVPVAHAAAADITCVGTETQTFSPGVLLTPQTATLTVHSIYNPCVSTVDPSITFGTTDFSITQTFSCLILLNPASGTMTFDWSNGTQSTFSFNRSATTVGGELVVTETGVITAGEFFGDTVERIVTGPTLNTLQCASPPGITSRTGVVSLVITSA
jgi:hypothetical protein